MMSPFTVKFNLSESKYFTALRLVAGAILSSRVDDLDALDDFKVCVTESVLIFKNCGFEEAEVTFTSGDATVCEVKGLGGKPFAGDNELSLALIPALVEDFEISRRGDVIEKVTFKV